MKDSDFSKLLKSRIEDARSRADAFRLGTVDWLCVTMEIKTLQYLHKELFGCTHNPIWFRVTYDKSKVVCDVEKIQDPSLA